MTTLNKIRILGSLIIASVLTVIAYQNCGKGLVSIQANSDTFRFSVENQPEVYSLSLKSQDSDLENLDLDTSYVVVAEVINKRSDLEYHWTLECPEDIPQTYVNSTDSYVLSCNTAGEIKVALSLKWDGGESSPSSLVGKFKERPVVNTEDEISVSLHLNQEFYVPKQSIRVMATGSLPSQYSWNVYCPGEATLRDLGANQNPFQFSCKNAGELAQVEMLSDRNTFSESISFSILDLNIAVMGKEILTVGKPENYMINIDPAVVPNMMTEISYLCPQENEKVPDSLQFSLLCSKAGKGSVHVALKDQISGVRLLEKKHSFNVMEQVKVPVDERVEPSIKNIQASDTDYDNKVPFVFNINNPSKVDASLNFAVKCPGDTKFSQKVPVALKGLNGNYSMNVECVNSKPGKLSLNAFLTYNFKKQISATKTIEINLKEKEISLDKVKINITPNNTKPYLGDIVNLSFSVENFTADTQNGSLNIDVKCPNASENITQKTNIPVSPKNYSLKFTCKSSLGKNVLKANITAKIEIAGKSKTEAIVVNFKEKKLETAPKFVFEKLNSTSDYVEIDKEISHQFKMSKNNSKLSVSIKKILSCPEGKTNSNLKTTSNVTYSQVVKSSCKKAGKASVQMQATYKLNGQNKTYTSPSLAFSVLDPKPDTSKTQIMLSSSGNLKFGETFKILGTVTGFVGKPEDGKLSIKVTCPGTGKGINKFEKNGLIPLKPMNLEVAAKCNLKAGSKVSVAAELIIGKDKKTASKNFDIVAAKVKPKISLSLKSGQSLPAKPNATIEHIMSISENTSKLSTQVFRLLKCPGKDYITKYIGASSSISKNFSTKDSCSTTGTAYLKSKIRFTIDGKAEELFSNELSFSVKKTSPIIYNATAEFKLDKRYFFGFDQSLQVTIKNFLGLASDGTLEWKLYCPGPGKVRKIFTGAFSIPVENKYHSMNFNCKYVGGDGKDATVYLTLKVGNQRKEFSKKLTYHLYKQEPSVQITSENSSNKTDIRKTIRHNISVVGNSDKLNVKLEKLLRCPGEKNYTASAITSSSATSFSKKVDSKCSQAGTAHIAAKISYSLYGETKSKNTTPISFQVIKPNKVWIQYPGSSRPNISCSALGIVAGGSCTNLGEVKNCCARYGSGREIDLRSIGTSAIGGKSCVDSRSYKCSANK